MNLEIQIEPLAARREAIPVLRRWFEAEWPSYYGPTGPGDALHDLQCFANVDSLPVGLVAVRGGRVCGIAALKAESITSHCHLSPWAAAGLVNPSERGRGIGAQLIEALELEARCLGYHHVYCGTSTAESLLQRCGWQLIERVCHEGEDLGIYQKAL
jgi:GNAT superfamily N-acetyltransferase